MGTWSLRRDHIRRCDQAASHTDSAIGHVCKILADYETENQPPPEGLTEMAQGLLAIQGYIKGIRTTL